MGYGNTLCVYIPETLRIKCILSTPAGQDGAPNKVIVNIPTLSIDSKSPAKKEQNQRNEKRKKIQQQIKDFLENNDDKLSTNVTEKAKNLASITNNGTTSEPALRELSIKEQEMIFKGILAQNDLNFFHKLELFQKIGLHIRLPPEMWTKFNHYVASNVSTVERQERSLINRALNLSEHSKFIAQRQLFNYIHRKSDDRVNVSKFVSFSTDDEMENSSKQRIRTKSETKSNQPMDIDEIRKNPIDPVKSVSQINHVLFATRDFSNFVIVCTEKRLLIWNLLTLRLHAALKLSVHRIVVDPYTSLVAAFTIFNECKCLPCNSIQKFNFFFSQCMFFCRVRHILCINERICRKYMEPHGYQDDIRKHSH